MTAEHNDPDNHRDLHETEPLRRSVEACRSRREAYRRHGERSVGQNLAWIGSLGALVVIPALLGVAAGRWLDDTFDSGVFWTASLIFAGVGSGFYLAWKRITET